MVVKGGRSCRLITREQDLEWVDSSRLEDSMLGLAQAGIRRSPTPHRDYTHPDVSGSEEGARKGRRVSIWILHVL